MTMRVDVQDRVVVVTGEATAVGRALASQFAEQGTWLILIDEDLGRLRKLTTLLRAAYPAMIVHRIVKIAADLRDPEQSDLAMEVIGRMFGEVDTFINVRRLAA